MRNSILIIKLFRKISIVVAIASIWEIILGFDGGLLTISGIKIRMIFLILNLLSLSVDFLVRGKKLSKPNSLISTSIITISIYGFLWSCIGQIIYNNNYAFSDGQSIIAVIYIFAIYNTLIKNNLSQKNIFFCFQFPLIILFAFIVSLWTLNEFLRVDTSAIVDVLKNGDEFSILGADAKEYSRFYFLNAILLPLSIFIFAIESREYKPKIFYMYFIFYIFCILSVGARGIAISCVPLLLIAFLDKQRRSISKKLYGDIVAYFWIPLFSSLIFGTWVIFNIIQKSRYFDLESLTNSDAERFTQNWILINEFLNHPLFGNGFGHSISSYVRSFARPFNYELYFQSLLMKTGLIGFAIYSFALVLILLCVFTYKRAIDSYTKICYTVIFITTIVQGSTNPILQNMIGHLLLFGPWIYLDCMHKYADKKQIASCYSKNRVLV
jgi:hypothetical protein